MVHYFFYYRRMVYGRAPAQVSYYPNDLLDQPTAKYVYRKQALSSLRLMDPGALGVAAAGGGAAERKTTDTLRR